MQIDDISDNGIECLRKSAIVPDDTKPTRYALRTQVIDGNNRTFQINESGQLLVVLEALGDDVSVNSNTQLKTTTFDSTGNEGQSIIGVNYVAGKSGVDAMTESLQSIDYEHHEIHNGSHFFLCGFNTLANNANYDFGITTPNTTKWAHVTFEAEGISQTEFYIFEDAVFTGGTSATPKNSNRNSTNASVLTVVINPSVTSTGTELSRQSVGYAGVTIASSKVGLTERNREIILKQNTQYIIRTTSRDNDNIVSYCANWYETISKN